MISIDNYFEKKILNEYKNENNQIEESCIHHSCLYSIFISLFGLIFQKRQIPIITKNILSYLRQETEQ